VYLRKLAEAVLASELPEETFLFPIPLKNPGAKTIKGFQDLLRMGIRAHFLPTQEILKILSDSVIKTFPIETVGAKCWEKTVENIHLGFGLAVLVLEGKNAADRYFAAFKRYAEAEAEKEKAKQRKIRQRIIKRKAA
jgi:hypothetical protein